MIRIKGYHQYSWGRSYFSRVQEGDVTSYLSQYDAEVDGIITFVETV